MRKHVMGKVNTRYSYTCGTQDRPYTASTVRSDSPKAIDGHCSRLSACGWYCRARAERAVSGLARTSRPIGNASALGPADRWPHTLPASGWRRGEHVALALLGSLRWRRAGSCRCTKPAKGVRKHGASATGHGHEEQEQERSPGRLQQ